MYKTIYLQDDENGEAVISSQNNIISYISSSEKKKN